MSQEGRHARSAHGPRSIVRQLGKPRVHQSTDEETTSNRKSPVHVCGEIRRGVTQSRSAYTLASPSTKPALYSPVIPRKARPVESSPGESSNQPRTSLLGNNSPGENSDQSWSIRPGNTHDHVLANREC